MLFSHCPGAQSNQDGTAAGECDISGLLEMLASVTDPRKARGRQYLIGFVLAVTVVAVLAGAGNYSEIAKRARGISQEMLMRLGVQWDWHKRRYRCPSKTVIRNVLSGIDGASWTGSQGNDCPRTQGKAKAENGKSPLTAR